MGVVALLLLKFNSSAHCEATPSNAFPFHFRILLQIEQQAILLAMMKFCDSARCLCYIPFCFVFASRVPMKDDERMLSASQKNLFNKLRSTLEEALRAVTTTLTIQDVSPVSSSDVAAATEFCAGVTNITSALLVNIQDLLDEAMETLDEAAINFSLFEGPQGTSSMGTVAVRQKQQHLPQQQLPLPSATLLCGSTVSDGLPSLSFPSPPVGRAALKREQQKQQLESTTVGPDSAVQVLPPPLSDSNNQSLSTNQADLSSESGALRSFSERSPQYNGIHTLSEEEEQCLFHNAAHHNGNGDGDNAGGPLVIPSLEVTDASRRLDLEPKNKAPDARRPTLTLVDAANAELPTFANVPVTPGVAALNRPPSTIKDGTFLQTAGMKLESSSRPKSSASNHFSDVTDLILSQWLVENYSTMHSDRKNDAVTGAFDLRLPKGSANFDGSYKGQAAVIADADSPAQRASSLRLSVETADENVASFSGMRNDDSGRRRQSDSSVWVFSASFRPGAPRPQGGNTPRQQPAKRSDSSVGSLCGPEGDAFEEAFQPAAKVQFSRNIRRQYPAANSDAKRMEDLLSLFHCPIIDDVHSPDFSIFEVHHHVQCRAAAMEGRRSPSRDRSGNSSRLQPRHSPSSMSASTPTHDMVLPFVAMNVFLRYNFVEALQLNVNNMWNFFVEIQSLYREQNPYHNSSHAADVLQTTNVFLSMNDMRENFSDVEILAVLFAAVVHDVGHLGIGNAFLQKIRHPLAKLFNDQSPLESMHAAVAFAVLETEGCNFFEGSESFTRAMYDDFRSLVIEALLGTDMKHHSAHTTSVKGIFENGLIEDNEVGRLLTAILHAADLSNPLKPFGIYVQWAERVVAEFWQQGDEERKRGMPISVLCDRNQGSNIAKSQVGFINFVVRPFVAELSPILPSVWLERMDANVSAMSSMAEHDEHDRVLNITALAAQPWSGGECESHPFGLDCCSRNVLALLASRVEPRHQRAVDINRDYGVVSPGAFTPMKRRCTGSLRNECKSENNSHSLSVSGHNHHYEPSKKGQSLELMSAGAPRACDETILLPPATEMSPPSASAPETTHTPAPPSRPPQSPPDAGDEDQWAMPRCIVQPEATGGIVRVSRPPTGGYNDKRFTVEELVRTPEAPAYKRVGKVYARTAKRFELDNVPQPSWFEEVAKSASKHSTSIAATTGQLPHLPAIGGLRGSSAKGKK